MKLAMAFSLALLLTNSAVAQNKAKLLTNKLACNSLQDIKDFYSMMGKGDAAMPLVLAKMRQNECRQWFAGAALVIEKTETFTNPQTNTSEKIFCARRTDGDDLRCFWIFPGGVQE